VNGAVDVAHLGGITDHVHGEAGCNERLGERWFSVHAPLMQLTKAEIVKLGTDLGVDLGMTTSCYDPHADGTPCGHCDACLLRAKGFAEAGVRDARAR